MKLETQLHNLYNTILTKFKFKSTLQPTEITVKATCGRLKTKYNQTNQLFTKTLCTTVKGEKPSEQKGNSSKLNHLLIFTFSYTQSI